MNKDTEWGVLARGMRQRFMCAVVARSTGKHMVHQLQARGLMKKMHRVEMKKIFCV